MAHTRAAASAALLLASLAAFAGLAGFAGHSGIAASVQPVNEIVSPLSGLPVAKMVGEWRGKSWMTTPVGERHEGEAVERAHWNLAGTAIIIEGYGYSKDPATGEITVGHDAIGIIEHDARTDTISILARRNGAEFTRHTLTVEADPDAPGAEKMIWSPNPGSVRFTLHLTADRWHEIGEWSRDGGKTWVEFMGVDLKPVAK